MNTKTLGYILAVIGLLGLAAAYIKEVQNLIPQLQLAKINSMTLTVVSIILIGVGIILIKPSFLKKTTKHAEEVPIYHGDKIVGYRRH